MDVTGFASWGGTTVGSTVAGVGGCGGGAGWGAVEEVKYTGPEKYIMGEDGNSIVGWAKEGATSGREE